MALSGDMERKFLSPDFDLAKGSNLLFVGRPGTGKTTLAKILAKKHDYIYLNASDTNGIDVVRNEITNFIRAQSVFGGLKVVVLDEASGLSSVGGSGSSAQEALRGLMEENIDRCKFILTANEQHKLIEALQSRCEIYHFNLSLQQCAKVLLKIVKAEGVKFDQGDFKKHVRLYFPDLRRVIGEFQKSVIDGKFVLGESQNSSVSSHVVTELEAKQNVFDIRASVIAIQDDFDRDWHGIMRGMFDIYVEKRKLNACVLVAQHMANDSMVVDQEVNFSALLFQLSELK